MLRELPSQETALDAYANIFGASALDRIRDAAVSLQGARVLHLSACPPDTQHAQLLRAVLSILSNLGVDVRLGEPNGSVTDDLFVHSFYESIEGEARWTPQLAEDWRRHVYDWATKIERRYDFFIVHDPQLLLLRRELARRFSYRARWIWHCHMDLRDCDEALVRLVADEVASYDVVAFEHSRFGGNLEVPARWLIPPAIDPLSGRNIQLPPEVADRVLRHLDVRPEWPLVVQVSRFDGWDDPHWALYTYEEACKLVPNLQFVLICTAQSRSEAFLDVERRSSGDRNLKLLTTEEVGDVEINALQGAAVAAIQQGVRKGFSPALLEASWKGRPVLAGEGGALSDQVVDGATGYVFKNFDDAAQRIAQLVEDPSLADSLGFEGHRLVRDNHLVVRWVEEYLNLLSPTPRSLD
jgi:trehalose synthase